MLNSRMFALALVAVMIAPAVHAQVSFQTAMHFAAGDGLQTLDLSAIACADFDGDGDVDLVVTSSNLMLVADPVMILANDGNGNFSIQSTLDVRSRPFSVAAVSYTHLTLPTSDLV